MAGDTIVWLTAATSMPSISPTKITVLGFEPPLLNLTSPNLLQTRPAHRASAATPQALPGSAPRRYADRTSRDDRRDPRSSPAPSRSDTSVPPGHPLSHAPSGASPLSRASWLNGSRARDRSRTSDSTLPDSSRLPWRATPE